MKEFLSAEVADLCGGFVCGSIYGKIKGIATDSREWSLGNVFIALSGKRCDGHDFIFSLADEGCRAFVVKKEWMDTKGSAGSFKDDFSFIVVEDTEAALELWAKNYRRTFEDITVIAISGSVGKTTTKELVARVLERCFKIYYSPGNKNSTIGAAVSVLSVDGDEDFAIFEAGIDHPGEMDRLVDILLPDCALLTGIGHSHIGFFKDQEEIAYEKRRLFSRLPEGGLAFVPSDDAFANFLSQETGSGDAIFYGSGMDGYGGISEDLGLKGFVVDIGGIKAHFSLPGIHFERSVMAAFAVSRNFEVDCHDIAEGIEAFSPLFGRAEVDEGIITVIKDCYNASPESVFALLEFCTHLKEREKSRVVLGDMLELGKAAERHHKEVGERAAALGIEHIYFFGKEMKAAWKAYIAQNQEGDSFHTTSLDAMGEFLERIVQPGDCVMLKGSRAMGLEALDGVLRSWDV